MTASEPDFLAGGGEMGALMRATAWATTPLGPLANWPQSLRTSVSTCLNCAFPILLWWGPDLVMLYNDEYRTILGTAKHPRALGRPGRETWPEIWHIIGPMLDGVLARGDATRARDLLLMLERNGYPEECYFSFSYSPIRDESGGIGGVFTPVIETTERVIGERRVDTLRGLAAGRAAEGGAEGACRAAAACLARNSHDLPFALIYRLEDGVARLAGAAGIEPGGPASPLAVPLAGTVEDPWELAAAAAATEPRLIEGLARRCPGALPSGALPSGAWSRSPEAALVLPIVLPGQGRPDALLVAGLNPHKALDGAYRGFLVLVADQLAAAIAEADAFAAERRRAEALAEIDRAKTAFFANISHEFRTPLTLLLGPLEAALAEPGRPEPERARLELAHRNALRLLRLVNTLLDFARLEAGRLQAVLRPTDLAALTADLAGGFRSACEQAGLALRVDCPPLPAPVPVDPELWERILLNLLSNAFKYTLEGEIVVSLRAVEGWAELAVRDTGTGIAAAELPHIFERFRRVAGAGGRSHEGSGIGLALVRELVALQGGTIAVESEPGRGSVFTVRLPLAQAVDATAAAPPAAAGTQAAAVLAEAARWLPEAAPEPSAAGNRPVVLLADDNADMRDYVRHLLEPRHDVVAVSDGAAALAAARARRPDLLLSDVMMPGLDGFALLRAVRSDPELADLPVILLSARAGEEARVEGLDAGADDYVTKPFTARELTARVSANLALAQLRREVARKERALRAEAERSRDDLRLALRAARAGAWDWDVAAGRRSWSPEFRALLGLDPEGAATEVEHWLGRMPPEDRAAVEAAIARAFAAGAPELGTEYRLIGPSGETRWLASLGRIFYDPAGRPLRVLGITIDVTERKRGEAALARYRLLSEHGRDIILFVDAAEGRILEANEAAVAAYGHDRARLLGLSIHDLRAPETRTTVAGQLRQADAEGLLFETVHVRADGRRFPVEVSTRGATIDGRRVLLSIARDITERRRAEDRQALLMAELDHRVRNILATVQAMIALTGRDPGDKAATIAALQGRIAAMASAHGLLTRRRWAGAELSEIVRDALQPFAAAVEVTGEAGALLRPKDALSLALVLHELATNAAKHGALSRPEGRVRIEWAAEGAVQGAEAAPIRFRWTESGGPPVRPPARRGFGSKLIAGALPGLELAFDPAGLRCTIPLTPVPGGVPEAAEAPAAGPEPRAAPAGERPLAGRRVLVVEDEPLAAMALGAALEEAGAELAGIATTLAAALAMADQPLDAAVIDVNLEGEMIFPAAERLVARGLPLLFATGYEAERVIPAHLRFVPVLQKPVDGATLVRRLAALLSAA
jgi:PAS domain S-box-containing protein